MPSDILQNMLNAVPEEERAHGTISNKTYYLYLREGASTFLILFFIFVFLLADVSNASYCIHYVKYMVLHRLVLLQLIGGCLTGQYLQYIESYSKAVVYRASGGESCNSNSSVNNTYDLSTNQRIGIYGGIVSTSVSLVFFRTVLSFLICLAASRHLHNKMFKAILRAPVLFFDTNPVGMPSKIILCNCIIDIALVAS